MNVGACGHLGETTQAVSSVSVVLLHLKKDSPFTSIVLL